MNIVTPEPEGITTIIIMASNFPKTNRYIEKMIPSPRYYSQFLRNYKSRSNRQQVLKSVCFAMIS